MDVLWRIRCSASCHSCDNHVSDPLRCIGKVAVTQVSVSRRGPMPKGSGKMPVTMPSGLEKVLSAVAKETASTSNAQMRVLRISTRSLS